MKNIVIIALVLIILAGGWYFWSSSNSDLPVVTTPTPTPTPTPPSETKDNLIRVTSPNPNDIVKSPLIVEGEARGNWYFEASFPVTLTDANGKILARAPAQAQEEWMTTDFVPFKIGLKFDPPETSTGFLIFEKDNPSGLPEHADEFKIPVRFR